MLEDVELKLIIRSRCPCGKKIPRRGGRASICVAGASSTLAGSSLQRIAPRLCTVMKLSQEKSLDVVVFFCYDVVAFSTQL